MQALLNGTPGCPVPKLAVCKNGSYKWPLEIQGLSGHLRELARPQINFGNAKKKCVFVMAAILLI